MNHGLSHDHKYQIVYAFPPRAFSQTLPLVVRIFHFSFAASGRESPGWGRPARGLG